MSRRLNLCKGTLVVLGLASLAACGGGVGAPSTTQSTTVSVSAGFTGADGVTSQITDTSRIVSLSGDITEFLFALGHGDSVVGIDVTTVFPEEAATLPIVGVGRFITAEGVLSQQPTLVIGDTQTAPVAVIDQLRASGITVVILPVSTTFDGLYEKIAQIGSIVGEAEAAGALVDTIARDVESARNDVPTGSEIRVAYIYTRGPDVVLMFGEGMVSNPVITAAGAIDAGAESGVVGSISATAEGIVAAAPDVIIVPEEGFSILGGLDEFLALPGVGQTPAAEHGRIYAYPEGDFLTFGPRVGESIRLLIRDLYEGP